jgi:hypothetical protein
MCNNVPRFLFFLGEVKQGKKKIRGKNKKREMEGL